MKLLAGLFTIFSILFLFNCNRNSVLYIYPQLIYCKYDYNLKTLEKRYQNVPIHRGTKLENFIFNLEEITNNDVNKFLSSNRQIYKPADVNLPRKLPFNGASVFQVFIDENGQVESIFLVYKSAPFFDLMVAKSLTKSHFKPLKTIDGKRTKYSVFVTYPIIAGKIVGAYVNGIPWKKRKNELKGLKMLPLTDKNTFDMYEVTEPPFLLSTEKVYPQLPRKDSPEFRFYFEYLYAIIVNEKGFVEKIETLNIPNSEWFEEIKSIIYKRRYKPALLNGKPVKCRIFEKLFYWIVPQYLEQNTLWDLSSFDNSDQ